MKTPTMLLLFAFCLWSFVPATLEARDRDTVDYYFKEAEKVLSQGDRSQALRLFETALSYVNNKNGKKNEYQYTELLDYLAVLKCEVGEVDQAIAYEDEVILWRREHKSDFGVIGDAVSKKAVFYSYKKDYDAAIKYAEEAADLLRRRFGEKDHVYSVNLMNLASYYSLRGAGAQDYQKAVEVGERAIKHIDNYTPEYAYALNSLVIYYAQAEMNDKANSLTPKAIQKGRSIFGRQSRAFADVLAQQAVRLANLHNYSQAIDYCVEARNIYAADSVVNVLPYARILGSLGSFCKQAERFDQGIEALTEACAVYQHLKYENTQEYVNCVSNLTALYRLKGDLEKADALAIQSAQALNSATATDNYVAYGKSLSEQGWMYAANGDFRHAIETEQRALDVFTENADTLNMARSMNDLSSHCFNAGQHDKALALCQQAIDLVRKEHLHTTVLGRAYNNFSLYHYRLGDNRRALELSRAAVRNYEEEGDVRGSHYAKILGNLAMFYYLNDSIDMAINIARRSLDLQASTLGEEHPDLVVTYHNLANYYLAKNDKEQMRHYFERALEMQSRLVRNNFSHLSTSGRELYWNTKNYIFKVAPSIAARSDGDDVLVGDAYNAQLFTKGILLNSEIDFKNFLFKTGETELLSKYEELERLHKRIDDFRHSAVNDHAEVERLQSQANRLERELIRGCKEFGDFTSNLSITYEQVAQALAPDAAAVEFVEMPMADGDRHYAALCIRHGWKYPRFVSLFTQNELVHQDYAGRNLFEAMRLPSTINAVYEHPQVGHLVWYPIMEALGADTHTVYFSPTGMLYQLGIEYLKYNREQRINERYEIHRLSSTKSLAQPRQQQPLTSAAVFGGLQYDMDNEEMARRHSDYSQPALNLLAQNDADNTRALFQANATAIDSLTRAGMRPAAPLPGTLVEAGNITSALRQQGIDTRVFTEGEGTEEAFKSLSGLNLSLIHVATHGFYFSDSDAKKNAQLMRLLGQASTDFVDEDRTMDYSGLLMAGANTVLRGRRLPENVENGILTAREISQLDLRGLDLVVLSACQTGKGELKEDGVYGLQRAFKKAGAKTLLMSLWSVSDAATQQMMSSFYQALAAGQSRFDAFATAQQAVRDAGYAAPYYWASFVMLDDNE